MPTEEEFILYERMAGGTGNIDQDAHIARHLQRIVSVPEREIASFVRTRDRDTVHKLRTVLKEMPRGQTMEMGGPRAGTRIPTSGMNPKDKSAKTKEISSAWTSNYTHQCVGASRGEPPVRTSDFAFDGIIRKGFHPHLQRWRQQADEAQVRVLADACRGLRNFITSKGPPTTYQEQFVKYTGVPGGPDPSVSRKTNISLVPIGAAGHSTEKEKEALVTREAAFRDGMIAAVKRQEEIRSGHALKLENRPYIEICSFAVVDEASAQQCLKPDLCPKWGSELKAKHNNDVHNKRQKNRLGITTTRRGENKLRLEGCAADLPRRPRYMEGGQRLSQSSPDLSR